MGFVKVVSTKELEPGKMIGFGEMLVANLDGNYYAIGNRCSHRGCKLSSGMLDGEKIVCPCHGSIFDVKTGRVIKGPANKPEPMFQVKIEGDQILVNT